VKDSLDKFEHLAAAHKDTVYRQMIRACGNREDAEDVLIEALLKAYRHLDQLRDQEAFRPWLAQIARRVCWQLKEKAAFAPLLQLSELEQDGLEIAAGDPSPEAQILTGRMKVVLQQAIGALPAGYREVYELRDLEEVPGEEVAARLGISLAAMKSRLHRARGLVRERLDLEFAR
jgi:RNA polymerase sigma-70 factor (ECF subfamily)